MSVGWKFQIIQETLKEEDNLLNVSMLCDIAGVSRSGYYRWVKAEDVRLERENKDSDKHYISYVQKSMAFCFEKKYFQKIIINTFYINKRILYNYNVG